MGGTSLSGGYVSIPGTMLAVLVISLIENVLVLANVDPYWVQFMLGALVLATVGLNRWRAVRAAKA
jgi:ribose transport system permease protein